MLQEVHERSSRNDVSALTSDRDELVLLLPILCRTGKFEVSKRRLWIGWWVGSFQIGFMRQTDRKTILSAPA